MISAAEIGNVQAIHPGYGFLAENAHFNEVCRSCNIDFIGPTPEAMARLGDKNAARKLAREAKVPVVPGSEGLIGDEAEAVRVAHEIGFPVLIKASAGGGGRGMRVALERPGAEGGLAAGRRPRPKPPSATAASISKNTSSIRGTSKCRSWPTITATSVHLWERDCSTQRRHQKLIEESPAPHLIARNARGDVRGGRAADQGGRIHQRRHRRIHRRQAAATSTSSKSTPAFRSSIPVTEMVTGIDLIKAQIRVAAGEPLPFTQEDIVAARRGDRVPHQRRRSQARTSSRRPARSSS